MTHTEAATMQLSSEGAVGVPLKFVLVRGRRVVEQRRTRLLCPSLEDVKGCVRQWACGVFTLRYVDDEGDLVTVDLDEEWAECVALWREARGADDADVCAQQRALRLVVTIGAQDGSAVCLGQQRQPRHRDGQRDGHRNRHHYRSQALSQQHMPNSPQAMWGLLKTLGETQQEREQEKDHQEPQTHDSETQDKPGHPLQLFWERLRQHSRDAHHSAGLPPATGRGFRLRHLLSAAHEQGQGQELEQADEDRSSHPLQLFWERLTRHASAQREPRHQDQGQDVSQQPLSHGRSEQKHDEEQKQTSDEVTAVLPDVMPCCRRNVRRAGKHGKAQRETRHQDQGQDVPQQPLGDGRSEQKHDEEQKQTSDEVTAVPDVMPCCRRSVRRAGKHGARCRKSAPQPVVRCAGPGCSFAVTRRRSTHCCVRCARNHLGNGQHGARCEQRQVTEAATPAVEPSAPPATEEPAVQEVLVQSNEEAVVHQAESEEEKQEADSAGVTALRNMGFDITADVRAMLERHNGDVALTVEEMLFSFA